MPPISNGSIATRPASAAEMPENDTEPAYPYSSAEP